MPMPTLPIHIICHANCEPPGYLCTYFDKRGISYVKTNAIENVISEIELDAVSGLVFMGGPYSVNDHHPWLETEMRFLQTAIEKNIPIMGVCFGAQLISRALGAKVKEADCMEAGWHEVRVESTGLTNNQRLNLERTVEVFEWHEDTFSLPTGAIPVFEGHGKTVNQGYVYNNILTMQFHVEMTEHMIHDWLGRYKDCMPRASGSVQSPDKITDNLRQRLRNLHAIADIIYDWWISDISKIKPQA